VTSTQGVLCYIVKTDKKGKEKRKTGRGEDEKEIKKE
jgi:hypothetical protein